MPLFSGIKRAAASLSAALIVAGTCAPALAYDTGADENGACDNGVGDTGSSATFRAVTYAAQNPLDAIHPLAGDAYRNPVIPGFHPDPSIVRVGQDYYLVNSTFAYFPGLPIFHSRDLVHWRQIGNAIDRPGLFDFAHLGIARGVFAPTLRFHDGLFYIVNTCVECGSNYLITARNPAGPWSKPLFLPQIDGIDPDLFFDADGRVWITNNGPPVGQPRYDGHRALWIQQYDPARRQMVGPRTVIVDGGVHPQDRPVWTEGPHIFRHGEWYYLIAAEGGTAGQHSQTVYRSHAVTGPYQPGPVNPILTQRDLDPARANAVYATGHADFVQTPRGDWWAVFLGTRPYRAGLASIGRETFLLPVSWRDGWPLILPAGTVVPQAAPRPALPAGKGQPAPEWLMLRTPTRGWYHLSAPGTIRIDARIPGLAGTENPSFLGQRQTERDETVSATLCYTPTRIGDRAGLAAFADEAHFFTFGIWQTAQGRTLVVMRRSAATDPADGLPMAHVALPPASTPVRLRIRLHDGQASFDYALAQRPWQALITDADAEPLASERSNQFTGLVIGPYAQAAARHARTGPSAGLLSGDPVVRRTGQYRRLIRCGCGAAVHPIGGAQAGNQAGYAERHRRPDGCGSAAPANRPHCGPYR
jgi:alpha-N-arabinofuranosidase